MTNVSIIEQRRLLEQLEQLVEERMRTESAAQASFAARESTMREQFLAERQRLVQRQTVERESLQAQYTQALSTAVREYEKSVETAVATHDRRYRDVTSAAEQELERTKAELAERREQATNEFENKVRELQRGISEFRERLETHRAELTTIEDAAWKILRSRFCARKAMDRPVPRVPNDGTNPLANYTARLSDARQALHRLAHQWQPAAILTWLILMLPVLVTTLGMLFLGVFPDLVLPVSKEDAAQYLTFAAGGFTVLGLMLVVFVLARPHVVARSQNVFVEVRAYLASGELALDGAHKLRVADADMRKITLQQQFQDRVRQFEVACQQRLELLVTQREARLREAAEQLQNLRQQAAEARDSRQQQINEDFSRRFQNLRDAHESQTNELQQRQRQEESTSREMFDRSWSRVSNRWTSGLAAVREATEAMWAYCRERFPDWQTTDWEHWKPPELLPSLKFGSHQFSLTMLDGGLPQQAELRPAEPVFPLPAAMHFSEQPALLFEAWDEGRAVASRAMKNLVLRLLTSLPPSKVRFTIIDPVGLGQSFSAFMHLADFDEKLVNHRIWTEPGHIQQRLSDLTEHMEDVIQTYLRNDFQTIDEYNRQAGEVSEPFHVLVVANFPAGFTDESAQRLVSIVGSGARCGVYSLISTDSKLEWPRNFNLADLESRAATLQWNGKHFSWRDEKLKALPVHLDEPPHEERMTDIIRVMGRKAKVASRVEVPFSTVALPPEHWWSKDSRAGIEVALGRAGASKLQYLRLGHGTSQHVLISGKTGSGKSTLLHALITNTAIHYSPDEVEFYLIDFKKGVEFKSYASRSLPHARVIAIESEREFGMSVLERLDQELRIRGDLFRQAGVQDVRSFRDARPGERMPRVLLIIDEFQEFFTQDDKLAQDAALLLDRLVRQGRAFGIHVLLGSQTLAGAYSLARSTLGQMAVRIALQCSEADSHLILSEDNNAARLLNRPGEAIYNDANGLFEGNHPFQVVWLSSEEQDRHLAGLATRVEDRQLELPPPLVFEGNAPADPAENVALRRAITTGEGVDPPLVARAWLGSAVAIKEPTAAVFRRQSGANLLLVGQQEELALGVLANCLLSLGAAPSNGQNARLMILDGARPESPEAGAWTKLASALPWNLRVGAPTQASAVITELAAEVSRRLELGGESEPPAFLLIYNLARFRELRRSDDDFGFSSMDGDKPPSASRQLADVLREGPATGVHTLVWCDTFNTVNRWWDRATLREFDQRVLLQMGANDSSNLMDSAAASRLGQFRALLYSEEQGSQEKFRPYGVPTDEWLQWIARQLAARNESTIS